MHQQQVSSNFYNSNNQPRQSGSYGYPGDWSAGPLAKSPSDVRHKKVYGTRSNGHDYDESSMSRLAKHTHGAPIIMSSRYRSKSAKPVQAFGHESKNVRNQNAFSAVPCADEAQAYDEPGFHANGTCLPRIIKPRKRRKKDRKPVTGAAMENSSPSPFTFAGNQSSGFMQSMSVANNNNSDFSFNQMNESFRRPRPPTGESNLFFNCDFDPSSALPLPSSTSSSPISMSNSSLSSSTNTSSCSCRLCDPNCKIWAFPLRRSFSDNAAELEHHNNGNSEGGETRKRDVGVIGGNRVKTEWNSGGESTLSILDMLEFSGFQRHFSDVNRLRSESSSDSGDSGCDLLLNGLNISDDIVSSTMKTVSDSLTSERLNAITRQLSEFSLMAQNTSSPMADEIVFHDSNNLSHLDANDRAKRGVCRDNSPEFSFNTESTLESLSACDFGDHQRQRRQQRSNLDNFLAMDMAASGSNCNYGNLMSPMLVNKQNYGLSHSVDLNNNQPDGVIDSLKERTLLFDCFDATWTGSWAVLNVHPHVCSLDVHEQFM